MTQYTIRGKQSSIDKVGNPLTTDSKLTYAKSYPNDTYYIRSNNIGRLLNPQGDYGDDKRPQDVTAGVEPHFKKVNAKVFEYYLAFLRTRNELYLNNAERESEQS